MESKKWALCVVFGAMLMSGCARKYESVELDNFNMKGFEMIYNAPCEDSKSENLSKNAPKKAFLYVSHNDETYTFALFDTLGAPLAHKQFIKGRFKNMKFLPPKSYYNQLFLGILTMIDKGLENATFCYENMNFKVRILEGANE